LDSPQLNAIRQTSMRQEGVRKLRRRIAVLIIGALAACRSGDREEEYRRSTRADVVGHLERYVAASRAVNPDSIAAFFAPNGVLLEPGIAPIHSADSIRAFMGSFPGVIVESASVAVDTVELLDSSAYVWGSYFERLHFPGQPRSEQRGRFVMQWVRASGEWRILRYYRIPVTTVVPPALRLP
jgi:uncharacterized protein (TIGR02246 family)